MSSNARLEEIYQLDSHLDSQLNGNPQWHSIVHMHQVLSTKRLLEENEL